MNKSCYGTFSKKKAECLECELAKWCKDSVFKSKSSVNLKKTENYKSYANNVTPSVKMEAVEQSKENISKIAAELINAIEDDAELIFALTDKDYFQDSLIPEERKKIEDFISLLSEISETEIKQLIPIFKALHKRNKDTCRIASKKILNPHLSYAGVAKELGLKNKQNVDYHLRIAKEVEPKLKKAILVEQRFKKKNK